MYSYSKSMSKSSLVVRKLFSDSEVELEQFSEANNDFLRINKNNYNNIF